MVDDLREEKLFPALPPEALEQLQQHGRVVALAEGEEVLVEGTRDYPFFAVLEGRIRVSKKIGGEDQLLAIHGPGHFLGEISMLTGGPAVASARALEPSKVIRIENARFREIAAECQKLGQTILAVMNRRAQEVSGFVLEQEKLAALGKLSAGLAHELNNPAAAARRATQDLKQAIEKVQQFSIRYDCRFTEPQREALLALQHQLAERRGSLEPLDAMDRSDKEEEVCTWLDQQGIENGWELAPTLVSVGLDVAQLEQLGSGLDAEALRGAVAWLEATLSMSDLSSEVEASMTRITELVGAMKEYSHMDQSSAKEIDVHKGLESTLKIFTPKLKNIEVVRQYDRSIPPIRAYAGELNQVWTNMIDNAIAAMEGKGRLTIRTAAEEEGILVEIADTGSGIAPDVKSHIFEPFFTTKPVGQGTGLGLDISYRIVTFRHHGTIRVNSKPGDTRFQVRLPQTPPKEPT